MAEAIARKFSLPAGRRILTEEERRPVSGDRLDGEQLTRKQTTYWREAWHRLRRNPIAMLALVLLILLLLLIFFGPMLSGQDYIRINAKEKNKAPGEIHWFGTDTLGRDLFSRVCVGSRLSLLVALVCSGIQILIGCAYGGAMAYFGGKVDSIMMRILEILNSFPYLLVTLLIMMVLGSNITGLLVAMCVTSWVGTARQMRGQIMQLRESEYVKAARMMGASPVRVIVRHLLPNTISILMLDLCSSIPDYIFTEASLSFLGMGLSGDVISLGVLISAGKTKMDFYPWQLICPVAVLVIAVLAFNMLGDGLRDALDPRSR